MEKLVIHSRDESCPSVSFDANAGLFNIQGKSTPDNPAAVYKPLLDYLLEYQKKPKQKSEFNIYLEYFNTSSSKCLFDILRIFSEIKKAGFEVVIIWSYYEEDEDSIDLAKDFQDFTGLEFVYQLAPRKEY